MDCKLLIVDLDGTLIHSDMLWESFLSATSKNLTVPFRTVLTMISGKAALKEYLTSVSSINVATLPYDEIVLDFIKQHRKKGGRVALVTASNQKIAKKIANHLGIFDEVYGSDSVSNLKGTKKATFLKEKFGSEPFQYMGDSRADLPVWRISDSIVTVNVSSAVRRKTERFNKPIDHLQTQPKSILPYFKALRPHQWLKNILVFLPLCAAHHFEYNALILGLLAFFSFSMVASSVYILNDLLDLNADRAHPRKCLRPFASGRIPIVHGFAISCILTILGAVISTILGSAYLITVGAYFLLTTAYSIALKRRIALDICILASLYTMRIIAGGLASSVELSVWLLAFSTFFFLSLASVKRQAELVDMAGRGALTAKGRGYHLEDLPIISMIGLATGYISVLVMALYLNSSSVSALYQNPEALWGICCILLYWITRVVLITHRGSMHDDPLVFALKDGVSHICFILIILFIVFGVLF